MDFKQLKYIMKIVQTGNITKAADELYMTQPALSHFITKVEEEEGVKLFDRSTTPITLTYAGEKYVDYIKQILEINNQLNREMSEIIGGVSGEVTIGIPPARAAELLPRILPNFVKDYPNVKVSTVEHNSRQLMEDVKKKNVDFAILPHLKDEPGVEYRELFKEELFLVAKKGSLSDNCWYWTSAGEKAIDITKLKTEKFILLKNGHGIRNAIDILFAMQGFIPDIFMETTNNETAFCIAATGLGVAIVPGFNIKTFKLENSIEVYKLSEEGFTWDIAAVLNSDEEPSGIVLGCLEEIQRQYNK